MRPSVASMLSCSPLGLCVRPLWQIVSPRPGHYLLLCCRVHLQKQVMGKVTFGCTDTWGNQSGCFFSTETLSQWLGWECATFSVAFFLYMQMKLLPANVACKEKLSAICCWLDKEKRDSLRLHRGCLVLCYLEPWYEDLLVCVIFWNYPAQWNLCETVLQVNDLCASRVITDIKKCCLSIGKCIPPRIQN